MQKYKEHSDAKRYKSHIKELQRSIRTAGLQVPLKVVAAEEGGDWKLAPGADRPHFEPGRYWLVDGHHRREALLVEGHQMVAVEILPGLGFEEALDACRLSNGHVIQPMSPDERTENAWSALNQKRDTYRRMELKQAAELLQVSEPTIKRFRKTVRDDGIKAGWIDADASRDKQKLQLQEYWNKPSTLRTLSKVPWRMYKRRLRQGSGTTSDAARRRMIKMAMVQYGFGTDGRFRPEDLVAAWVELGKEADRADAHQYLLDKYKPKISQPKEDDDDDDDGSVPVSSGFSVHPEIRQMAYRGLEISAIGEGFDEGSV
ncbi:ParB N-terminal domain-containing protein [Pseudomonas saliphila]|uniref:ParB N-terminal domain-containing protein n=1 Tax=Pseudomonas saliphila TaxID=2586906 RepID=UPI0015B5DB27|nr:ParB N-terminal domain-containing protein [Pseudomonas saliphila]